MAMNREWWRDRGGTLPVGSDFIAVGCSSGAQTVQATPQNPADLNIPDEPAHTLE